jgi:hypothetical protein
MTGAAGSAPTAAPPPNATSRARDRLRPLVVRLRGDGTGRDGTRRVVAGHEPNGDPAQGDLKGTVAARCGHRQ